MSGGGGPRRGAGRKLGVALVDPLQTTRAGLALLLRREPDLEVLVEEGSADGVIHGLRAVRRSRLAVLVDLGLERERDAYWLIRTLREEHPSYTILAMGPKPRPLRISRALFVGADGFLDKGAPPDEFLDGLRRAAAGEMVLIGASAAMVGAIARGVDHHREVEGVLTARERQVLSLAAEGLTAREVAARLGVRERTITTHLTHIYGKLDVRGRVEAIRTAALSGLVHVAGPEE